MRRFLTFTLAFLGAMAFAAGPVLAAGDNTIETSSPAANEVIDIAPTQLQLKYTLPVGGNEAVGKMGLSLSCESQLVNLGPPVLSADGLTVSAALTQVPPNGTCVVSWSLPDGSTGSFTFEAQTQATTTIPNTTPGPNGSIVPPGGETVAAKPRVGGPLGLARWISFFFVSALFGGIMFIRLMWPEGVEYPITERYFRQISILAILSTYMVIVIMNAREASTGITSSLSPTAWGPILAIGEGRAVFIRLLCVMLLTYFAWITERVFMPTLNVFVISTLSVTMLTFGFDRATGRSLVIGILTAVVHMALIAIWIGGIAIIWRVVLHGPGDIDLVHALQSWSRFNTPLTIGIVLTGVIQVWRLDGLSLINSGHGRVMLFKVLIVCALLFVSAAIRQFIMRGMQRANSLNEKVVYRLKRPVGLELSISVIVLALSSWALSMRPPYILLRDNGPVVEYAIVQDLQGKDDFHVRLSMTPGNIGVNKVLIEFFGPERIQNFTIKFTPENPNFPGYTLFVPITRPGAALANEESGFKFNSPGTWTAVVTGVTTIGDLEPLTTTFVIADGTTVTTIARQGLAPASATTSSTLPASSVAPVVTLMPPVVTTIPATGTIAPTVTTPAPAGTTLPAG